MHYSERGNYQELWEQSFGEPHSMEKRRGRRRRRSLFSLSLNLTSLFSFTLSKKKLQTQAARVIANLVVAAGGVLIRAGVQAYRQAIVSESFFFF